MRSISTEEFVARIQAGRVKAVLPMIAEHARETWYKLPDSEKMVRSLPDLIQEGINHTVTHVAVNFDLSRATKTSAAGTFKDSSKKTIKFSSFLHTALDNFYTDIIRKVYADKRLIPHGMLSADTTRVVVNGRSISLLDKIKLTRKTRYDSEERIINRIDAERAFIKAYRLASPNLRRHLIKWLLQPKVSRNRKGSDFKYAKKEFRQVAKPFLPPSLCKTIQDDYLCRSNIANQVAIRFHTQKKKSGIGFLNCEEFAVAPILNQKQIIELIPLVG
jgi:hypothetical protein